MSIKIFFLEPGLFFLQAEIQWFCSQVSINHSPEHVLIKPIPITSFSTLLFICSFFFYHQLQNILPSLV